MRKITNDDYFERIKNLNEKKIDNMRRITQCSVSQMPQTFFDPMPRVEVVFDDGSTVTLFEYYPDEISFEPREFIGLTEDEARSLKGKKDRNFLQS